MKTYTTRTGKTQYMPSLRQVQRIIEGENTQGFCLACGAMADGVEPDARKYTCACCGAAKVYGAEELTIMGLVY